MSKTIVTNAVADTIELNVHSQLTEGLYVPGPVEMVPADAVNSCEPEHAVVTLDEGGLGTLPNMAAGALVGVDATGSGFTTDCADSKVNLARKPVLCTELSLVKVIRIVRASPRIEAGTIEPDMLVVSTLP